ncbi:glycosyltransferase [Streptomyces roseolilacinus]|uniref:glycosyltransferase n=1 Tax=Streptomyces roseolilacinus TaxID=66904 RepID=UPI00380B4942
MRVLITAAGSRGDVAPYTGVGARLREAGHEVVLAAPEEFAGLVEGTGPAFHALPVDPRGGGAGAPGPGGGSGGTGELIRRARAFLGDLGDGLVRAAEAHRPDVLLLSTTTAPLGWHVAEATGVPSLGAYLQPVAPTREFPPVVGGGRPLGRWGNRAAGRLSLRVVDRVHADAVRELRHRLGLPPATGRAVRRRVEESGWPVLHGFSEVLVPRPADWRPGLEVAGAWWPHVPADAELPDAVEDFLRAGPPPVFVGFGSMGGGQGERLGEVAVRALRLAGVRGVVQAGWAGLSASDGDALLVGDVPHALLLPRTAAVVHHAGAGTTTAALRAGVPSVPVPFTADQPFWARRVAAIGAGTAAVPAAGLTAGRLAEAIRAALDGASYGRAAAAAARRLAREDGAAAVVRGVEAAAG